MRPPSAKRIPPGEQIVPPWAETDRIAVDPLSYLRRTGTVFGTFDATTQDSGNVSYGVEVDGLRYFVKTAGPPDAEAALPHADRVPLLRNALELRRSCASDLLPKLESVLESPLGPMLVYEWVAGELIGVPRERRHDPNSAFARFRALAAEEILTVLDRVYALHADLAREGWISVDFYDGCLMYDFAHKRVRVIDLDMYHRGPFVNSMGRMFGSSRFMAPEELERGRTIDERTMVYVMGRTAAVLCGDGSLSREAYRGGSATHAVITRACAPLPGRRYDRMEEFDRAWRTARQSGASSTSLS